MPNEALNRSKSATDDDIMKKKDMISNTNINRFKSLGQFYTPVNISTFMARWTCISEPKTILDPGVGHFALLDACHYLSPKSKLIGYDIDSLIADYFKQNVDYEVDIHISDYLYDWGHSYDGIICNPPYNKFQTIKDRGQLISDFKKNIGIRLSGYTNILGYFLIKSVFELPPYGRSAYIVPYEFLNTGYGEVIKQYLIDQKTLSAIIKFDNENNVFEDVITTTCILLMQKGVNESVSFIEIDSAEKLNSIDFNKLKQQGILRNNSDLEPSQKWLKYFEKDECSTHLTVNDNFTHLSNVCKVKRGIATGDNDYFTLNKGLIDQYGISKDCIMPCFCKSSDVKTIVFTQKDFQTLVESNKKVFLFNGCNATTDRDRAYIKYGEDRGSNKKYLTSHRIPWYAIENKKNAPILITVFNRDGIKVIRNEAGISNLTTFHGLHPTTHYDNQTDITVIFCYLCSTISKTLLFANKREYGDKLNKFEPNDLNESLVLDPDKISVEHKNMIINLYESFKHDKNKDLFINSLDSIFRIYVR